MVNMTKIYTDQYLFLATEINAWEALMQVMHVLVPDCFNSSTAVTRQNPITLYLHLVKYLCQMEKENYNFDSTIVVMLKPISVPVWLVDCCFEALTLSKPQYKSIAFQDAVRNLIINNKQDVFNRFNLKISYKKIAADEYYRFVHHQIPKEIGKMHEVLCRVSIIALSRFGVISGEQEHPSKSLFSNNVSIDPDTKFSILDEAYNKLKAEAYNENIDCG